MDGTLWYFVAVYKYLQASGDEDYVLHRRYCIKGY
jgi:hypothetical protein